MEKDVHTRLAEHMSTMGMGMPMREELVAILQENFSPEEAKVALLLPTTSIPLRPVDVDTLTGATNVDSRRLVEILEDLAQRGLIYAGKTDHGKYGYALHQSGFGFPQAYFWKGEDTPYTRKMTKMVLRYYNRKVTREAFGGKKTKPYRYIPIGQALDPGVQAVLPHDRMDAVLEGASRFAVASCPCRVEAGLMGRPCEHPREVCLKFDEMAEYLIERGLGREITREQACAIVDQAAEAGLVHFVDNAAEKIKHNCNCCGCACWNVGSIRRRKIPRDELMAVYFLRETDPQVCVGCGECIEICPVAAIRLEDDLAVVDQAWCIGCGVCASRCAYDALQIKYREDQKPIPADFKILHHRIREERVG